ncbi:putative glycosyl transferase [Trichoderma reesei RUT C-30]|jgi:mannosyltransferase OCH1-like enzyme|uniref:Putative glycosyl transferase n=1 Tax=Hypocrea jecorina (strain ATCC 56765 / BCRC 32924 / NRRL 11460 / Rut C-30) TaxID=1344414 RepID=A0A024SF63_HYPJR|nr:putative glycosyl transferase [Trichoderma reesei RUT C-30]
MLKAHDAGYLNIRLERRARTLLWLAILSSLAAIFCFRHLLYTSGTLLALPASWAADHETFILSEQRDAFDVTFANYSINQLSAAPYEDLVPPVLHHIALGSHGTHWRTEWKETVQSCIDIHPGWETHIWTDETASRFVEDKFPDLKPMWDNYAYPVERIDALRYMLLYEYGGVVLDMDLKCTRALGPLRRFSFVAPEAYPAGFSIGFMMASRRNDFVGALVGNLETYNKRWLGLPYATVMFSTGCHYASVVHAAQPQPGRGELKILPGPMHSLNGRVKTPIFEHLGSSSWHSYDARFIMSLGRRLHQIVFFCVGVMLVVLIKRRVMLRRVCGSCMGDRSLV